MKDMPLDDENDQTGESVEIEEDKTSVEDTEDGGAIIKMGDEEEAEGEGKQQAHFANIVDDVDQGELATVVAGLLDKVHKDREAREKRDKQQEEGLRRTGLGDDAPGGASFTGANKVVHPMLVEACVDFSARLMKEIFPPNGPVRSKILGKNTGDKQDKAQRKVDFMNWQATEQIPELRGELEQLSTQLPLGGGQYMKARWREDYRRPSFEFVAIDDILLPFAATNFYSAERKTHVQYVTAHEFNQRVKSGMYRDMTLGIPSDFERTKSAVANDKIEGRKETSYNEDGLRVIYEIYTSIEFDEGMAPYIISIDETTGEALSLYRNWDMDDENKKELEWIVEFPFIPWRGAYPIGLTHMIGGLSAAATGALRALLDSAHIQNVPTMLKLKGGPNGQTINVQPTEVVEIDGGAMVDDVRKIAMPLPFNGPSPVLMQLLGFLIDAGKGVVQTSFEKLSDQNPNQPVGTTMALIEQGMVVYNSIHSRIHNSMSRLLKILHRINSAYLTDEDIKQQAPEFDIKPEDFDGPMDVVPVSDPAIFSETQRFAQMQALLQRAQAMPQMYNQRKVEETFLRQMRIDTSLLLDDPASKDVDPVTENVMAAMGKPILALPTQDHLEHIAVHLAFLQSPTFGSNPAIQKTYLYPMALHLRDHLLNFYLKESQKAVHEAVFNKTIDRNSNAEAEYVTSYQHILEGQIGALAPIIAQIDQMAQQFAPKPQMPPDSTMQVAQLNAQIQGQALAQRAQSDQAKLQSSQAQLQAKLNHEMQIKQLELQIAQMRAQQDAQLEQFKQQQDNQRTAINNQTRLAMNNADNDTAKQIAAAEVMSGENVALTTGTGINPGTR